MPRVPVITPQAVTAPIATPMQREAPVSAGLQVASQTLQGVGSMLSDIAEKEQRQAEAVEISDFETFAEERWTTDFYDDENGFRRLRGQEAFGQEQAFLESHEKALDERIAQIRSPRARRLAQARKAALLADRRRQIEQYLGKQREVAKSASKVARMATGLDALARNYSDPAARAESLESVRATIFELAPTEEAAEAEWIEYQQKAAGVIIQRYLDDNDVEGARAYYAQTADVLGVAGRDLKRQIEVVENRQKARRIVRDIIEGARGENGRVDVTAARARLAEIEDEGLLDEVEPLFERAVRAADDDWKRIINDNMNRALTQYERGGNSLGAIDPRVKDWLIEHAPKEWRAIERMARADADYWRRRQQERGAGGGESDEDLRARTDLIVDIQDNPDLYADMTSEEFFLTWRPRMSASSYKWAVTRFEQHKRRVANGMLATMGEFNIAVNGAMAENNITKNEDRKLFKGRMASWLDQYLSDHKKWPTQQEIRDEIARQVEDVKVKRWYGTGTTSRFRADPEDIIEESDSPEPPEAPRMSKRDRARQLWKQGVPADEADRILAAEGYE